MVENVLVKEILTESMIKAGEELTLILDQMNWPVTAFRILSKKHGKRSFVEAQILIDTQFC